MLLDPTSSSEQQFISGDPIQTYRIVSWLVKRGFPGKTWGVKLHRSKICRFSVINKNRNCYRLIITQTLYHFEFSRFNFLCVTLAQLYLLWSEYLNNKLCSNFVHFVVIFDRNSFWKEFFSDQARKLEVSMHHLTLHRPFANANTYARRLHKFHNKVCSLLLLKT